MPYEEMGAALEALEAVLIVIIEETHEIAVASAPEAIETRRERAAALGQAGTDVVTLSDACAVLLRRARSEE